MSGNYYPQLAEKTHELLGDGEWHPYEQTLRALMKVIPPGPALRRSEMDRTSWQKQRGLSPGPRKRERSIEDQIYSGQRAIVRDYLHNKARFETDRPGHAWKSDPDRQIRLVGRVLRGHANVIRSHLEVENRELRREINKLKRQLKDRNALVEDLVQFLNSRGFRNQASKMVASYDEDDSYDDDG